MAKTKETLALEAVLDERSRKKREYGCAEVTIGFKHDHHGDEIVDYMSMDAEDVFCCYELKVSLNDLRSDNKKSWYGDYNYLVISEGLWARVSDFDQYIPPYVGILAGHDLVPKRNAKRKSVSEENRAMLKSSLLRSVYWKMVQNRDSQDLEMMKNLKKELETVKSAYETDKLNAERITWTYEDYERYYRLNRQSPQMSLEKLAKQEREQYFARKKGMFSWQKNEDTYVCPQCHKPALYDKDGNVVLSDCCPHCGSDLRKI